MASPVQSLSSVNPQSDLVLSSMCQSARQTIEDGKNCWYQVANYITTYPDDFFEQFKDITLAQFEKMLLEIKMRSGREMTQAFKILLEKQVPFEGGDPLLGTSRCTLYYSLIKKGPEAGKTPENMLQIRKKMVEPTVPADCGTKEPARADEWAERTEFYQTVFDTPFPLAYAPTASCLIA